MARLEANVFNTLILNVSLSGKRPYLLGEHGGASFSGLAVDF